MYAPDEMKLPAFFGKCDLLPIRAMKAAMEQGTDRRANQNSFAVFEDEARAIIALTYGMITTVDEAIARVLKQLGELGQAKIP